MTWQHRMDRKCIGAGNEPVSAIQDGGQEAGQPIYSCCWTIADEILYYDVW